MKLFKEATTCGASAAGSGATTMSPWLAICGAGGTVY
uniref:Uncharacterized protein n=1 Tax=Arundo donax TaxID=35708 RepID=A0A0A9FUW9_ARUDO